MVLKQKVRRLHNTLSIGRESTNTDNNGAGGVSRSLVAEKQVAKGERVEVAIAHFNWTLCLKVLNV